MTKTETRTQYRATCPICFREHAVRNSTMAVNENDALMVQHGYQRPEGWHQNVGECTGTSQPHFGTKRGRVVAAGNAAFIRRWAETRRADAETLRKNPPATVIVSGKYLPKERKYEDVSVDASDCRYDGKLKSMIYSLETDAKHADQSAAEIEKRVREWKPVAPRSVEVEKGPTVHFKWKRSRLGIYCRFSNWSGKFQSFVSTKEWDKVNCTRCLKAKPMIESGEYKDVA